MSANQAKNHMKHVLSIGTLCGLILATVLVLSIRDRNRVAAESLSTPLALTAPLDEQFDHTTNTQADLLRQVAALQAQNQQLRTELQATQGQIAEYQQQVTQAIQIIRRLQDH